MWCFEETDEGFIKSFGGVGIDEGLQAQNVWGWLIRGRANQSAQVAERFSPANSDNTDSTTTGCSGQSNNRIAGNCHGPGNLNNRGGKEFSRQKPVSK